jgi:dephospho-CoA kinase
MPFTVGLTGGIACGKSTVAKAFNEYGIETVDADQIVRKLLHTDEELKQQIKEHFGQEYLDQQGEIQREALRARIFESNDDRQLLESLIHPKVRDALELAKSKFHSSYGILVVPLLIEAEMTDLVDHIIIVDVPEEIQISRTMQRDQISRDMAMDAISSQIPRADRLKYADDVIDNTAPLQDLRDTVSLLHKKYLEMAMRH